MTSLTDSGFLSVAGSSLEFRMIGPRPDHAPTVVLLHEGLGSLGLWRAFPERLAERTGLGVFAYSRAGYGRSSPVTLPRPLDYMRHEAVAVVPILLDAIGFSGGILLGHSDGASIATIHAGSFSDPRLKGLVLLAPHFFVEAETIAEIANAKRAYEATDLRTRLARHHANVDVAFRGWNNAWLDPGFAAFDITAMLAAMRVPALVIQGAADPYGTLKQVEAARDRSGGPVETVVIPDCGHAPHLDAPDRSLDAIADFVRRALTPNGRIGSPPVDR